MQDIVAETQYRAGADDLLVVLALVRGGSLAAAGERLGLNPSTVFRALQRVERGLGSVLFERTRSGYVPRELAHTLAEHAERIESAVESARSEVQQAPNQAMGTVRITTTDTILHGLVAPALASLHEQHPLLAYELHTGNALANLSRRDADIAVRATGRPPAHLVGRKLGAIRIAVFGRAGAGVAGIDEVLEQSLAWIAPDDALPDHPSVLWRRKHHPRIVPRYRVDSILTVAEFVSAGLGVGVLPLFLAASRDDLVQVTPPLDGYETDLWLLAHPEARHLRRISIVYAHLASAVRL